MPWSEMAMVFSTFLRLKPINAPILVGIRQLKKKILPILDPKIDSELSDENYKPKKHPGTRKIGNVYLPPELRNAGKIILADFRASDMSEVARSLTNFLISRKEPVENLQIRLAAQDIENNINSQNRKVALSEPQLQQKVMKRLRETLYHWQPVEYNYRTGLVYLMGKFSADFAALTRVLMEIALLDPTFRPKTVFDFGSGLGSVIWAVRKQWPDGLKEYLAVDSSADMNKIASLLLQGGNESYPPDKAALFRQFLPASSKISYDMVVSTFSLLELPSAKNRLEVIDILWRKADKYLVLVENGTNAGFQVITEARDYILQKSRHEVHVLAPCSHDMSCPRFSDGTGTPCNFEVKFKPIEIGAPRDFDTARFSYVVLRKGGKLNDQSWPRIVRPVLLRSQNTICRLCCSDGSLKEVIITAKKYGKNLYKCSRKSQWGDLLPVSLATVEKDNIESDEAIETEECER